MTADLARPNNRNAEPQRNNLDVLIVGAGPTGLALATQLQSFGATFRIIDQSHDRARESRALAVQARTLELLQSVGLADLLVAKGNTSARLELHFEGGRHAEISLGGFGASDTRFPFILFISQAETEAILDAHLTAKGVTIERGVQLTDLAMNDDSVDAVLRMDDGREQRVRAKYLVGCDGPHSTVRKRARISFEGDAYLQDFMLGDVEADAKPGAPFARDALHSFGGQNGIAMFFPLGHPTTWRVIAMSESAAPRRDAGDSSYNQQGTSQLSLEELQAVVDGATGGAIALRDPAWLTHFRLHHRQAARYRRGRVFLAGDAGHIHSPVGAQGMNTGIQDAWNLGWKLALVSSGVADPTILDSYETERWPVGRALLRYTDRAFGLFTSAMSSGAFAAWVRRTIVARALPRVMRANWIRRLAFRFISDFSIRYRSSSAVTEGAPRLKGGPHAGDRLPDVALVRDDRATTLQRELTGPAVHLLLCGEPDAWTHQATTLSRLRHAMGDALSVHRLTRSPSSDALVDSRGEGFARLGVSSTAQYLIRPDGYIAYRCAGSDLTGVEQYLRRWFPPNNGGARD